MEISNNILLRPRFKITVKQSNDAILKLFEAANKNQKNYLINLVDEHVFIRIPKEQHHFWTPQLHLEIINEGENHSALHGFFGPNPRVWTLFIFLHFVLGILFIGLGIWIYTNSVLDKSYALQVAGMSLLIICWVGLYIGGRIGKVTGRKQMHELHKFMNNTLHL